MIRRLLAMLLCLVSGTLIVAAPASSEAPKLLLTQVQRLTELLRDGYAFWYPDATMVQMAKRREGEELALVIFTVAGFGGGNNHMLYFAAFSPDTDEKGKQHFMLIDFIPIGGKGWRGIMNLNARVTPNPKGHETSIAIDALEVSGDDLPNFPSKKVTINLLLKDGRLVEQKMLTGRGDR